MRVRFQPFANVVDRAPDSSLQVMETRQLHPYLFRAGRTGYGQRSQLARAFILESPRTKAGQLADRMDRRQADLLGSALGIGVSAIARLWNNGVDQPQPTALSC